VCALELAALEQSKPAPAKYSLELTINELPPLMTNGTQHSWRARAGIKSKWKNRTALEIGGRIPPSPLTRARVKFVRHSSNEPDFDNLVTSFKPIMDGLVLARVLIDDAREIVGQPEYVWAKEKRNKGHVMIYVEEVGE
jgi:hypothetical protein